MSGRSAGTKSVRVLVSILGLILLASAGCNMATFDELKDGAPVRRVEQAGDIDSAFFGQVMVGLSPHSEEPDQSGLLVVAGTGAKPAINTLTFSPAGDLSNAQSSTTDYRDRLGLGELQVSQMVPAPSGQALEGDNIQLFGPFAYVGASATDGTTGRVVLADVVRFSSAAVIRPAEGSDGAEFGTSVAAARFDDTAQTDEDLVVGGRGRVWLYRFADWPKDPKGVAISVDDGAWPTADSDGGLFTSLAAGKLDPRSTVSDQVAVAAPKSNYVALIADPAGCAAKPEECAPLRIPLPQGLNDGALFGRGLLIADIDDDDIDELIVGAPGADAGDSKGQGAVYVYDLDGFFEDGDPLPDPKLLAVPGSAKRFGHSLVLGRIEGIERRLLAVGAPGTPGGANATILSVGRIYLYESNLERLESVVELKDAGEGHQLGLILTTMPFLTGRLTADLLAAGAPKAALVFFAHTTEKHDDVRVF